MTYQRPSLRAEIGRSIRSGRFGPAVLWGALVGCFVAILEYNLTGMHSETYAVRYAMTVGGGVTGVLYGRARSWRAAARAGGYAGAVPIAVLGPLAYLFLFEELPTTVEFVGTVLVFYPAAIGIGVLFGALGGAVGHGLVTAVSDRL